MDLLEGVEPLCLIMLCFSNSSSSFFKFVSIVKRYFGVSLSLEFIIRFETKSKTRGYFTNIITMSRIAMLIFNQNGAKV